MNQPCRPWTNCLPLVAALVGVNLLMPCATSSSPAQASEPATAAVETVSGLAAGSSRRLGGTNAAARPTLERRLPLRLPGEFESQGGLLLGCHELAAHVPEVFADVVRACGPRVPIVALVRDRHDWQLAQHVLAARSIAASQLRYVLASHDTMWARDYGPLIVEQRGGPPLVIDAEYDVDRARDDRVPSALSRYLGLALIAADLEIAGGNLLSNGQGLCVATNQLLERNLHRAGDEETLAERLTELVGCRRMVLLEPLAGEPTGHVDMFVTFTSANTVVVASCDAAVDPVNAALLDRNAQRLAALDTPAGPLEVVRLPLPPHDDGTWRTYTNVVYANGVLLVPIYPGLDAAGQHRALATFSRLKPHWQVRGIDARRLARLGGALHCVVMNLGPIGALPVGAAPRHAPADTLSPIDDLLLPDDDPFDRLRRDVLAAEPLPLGRGAWPRPW